MAKQTNSQSKKITSRKISCKSKSGDTKSSKVSCDQLSKNNNHTPSPSNIYNSLTDDSKALVNCSNSNLDGFDGVFGGNDSGDGGLVDEDKLKMENDLLECAGLGRPIMGRPKKVNHVERLDHDKIKDLARIGWTASEIAEMLGYKYISVYKVLTRAEDMLSDCKDYLSTRTQRYIGQQERLEAVISRLVDEMLSRDLKIVRDNDLASLLKNTEVVLDGVHRRERLETGKSTSNVQNLWQGVVNASDKHMLRQYENGDVIDVEFTVKG